MKRGNRREGKFKLVVAPPLRVNIARTVNADSGAEKKLHDHVGFQFLPRWVGVNVKHLFCASLI
jgi:hypothetical protein